MALIACKECGTEVSSSAASCPKCGWKLPKPNWVLRIVLALVAGFAIIMVLGSIAGNTPEGRERSESRNAIANCWHLQKGGQVPAEACKLLETEFFRRWGRTP